MASSDIDNTKLYFCHQCKAEVSSTEDITCSKCHSGAIEELQKNEPMHEDVEFADAFATHWEGHNRERRRRHRTGPLGPFQQPLGHGRHSMSSSNTMRQGPLHSQFVFSIRPNGSQQFQVQGGSEILDTISQLFGMRGLQSMGGNERFGGSFGDYAWGPNALDNIITQLMNQLDNPGPPPAESTKIDSLPIYEIQQKDIDENVECAICRDDFNLSEKVNELPCKHKYHQSCIVTWLKMHDSCPICRCNLNGERSEDEYQR